LSFGKDWVACSGDMSGLWGPEDEGDWRRLDAIEDGEGVKLLMYIPTGSDVCETERKARDSLTWQPVIVSVNALGY